MKCYLSKHDFISWFHKQAINIKKIIEIGQKHVGIKDYGLNRVIKGLSYM
jgi:hypothetical protein